jgi:hypothetical protein
MLRTRSISRNRWNWYGALYPGRLQIQLDGRLPFVWMVQAAVVAAPQELPFEPANALGGGLRIRRARHA